jgi:hypothetical protein
MKELLRFLLQPAVRQHVCKLVYAGERQAQGAQGSCGMKSEG